MPNPRTVNAILFDDNDELLLQGIRRWKQAGWSTKRIAKYYNIYYHGPHGKMIPPNLYNIKPRQGNTNQ